MNSATLQVVSAVAGVVATAISTLAFLRAGRGLRDQKLRETIRAVVLSDVDPGSPLWTRITELLRGDRVFFEILTDRITSLAANNKDFSETIRNRISTLVANDRVFAEILKDRITTLVANDKAFAECLVKLLVQERFTNLKELISELGHDLRTLSQLKPTDLSRKTNF